MIDFALGGMRQPLGIARRRQRRTETVSGFVLIDPAAACSGDRVW